MGQYSDAVALSLVAMLVACGGGSGMDMGTGGDAAGSGSDPIDAAMSGESNAAVLWLAQNAARNGMVLVDTQPHEY